MGIGSSAWFKSYLFNRHQTTSVNNVESDPLTIQCGVPQGSILGPLLFLCYINDMPISVTCKLISYADDSALLVSGKDPCDIAKLSVPNLSHAGNGLLTINSHSIWVKPNQFFLAQDKKSTKLMNSMLCAIMK